MESEEVKEKIKEMGAHLVGIASVNHFRNAPKGHRPSDFLPNSKSVIVVGLRVPLAIVETIPSPFYEAMYDRVNEELSSLVYRVASYLEREGFDAFPIDPDEPDYLRDVKVLEEGETFKIKMFASLSHRHAAVLAGLGEFTPASYVVVPELGPRVRFASVITSAPLEPDPPLKNEFTWGLICKPEKCGYACIKACPVKALPGNGTVDHYKCRKYRGPQIYTMNYFKEIVKLQKIPPRIRKLIVPPNYRSPAAQLCGKCLKACPIGREK